MKATPTKEQIKHIEVWREPFDPSNRNRHVDCEVIISNLSMKVAFAITVDVDGGFFILEYTETFFCIGPPPFISFSEAMQKLEKLRHPERQNVRALTASEGEIIKFERVRRPRHERRRNPLQ